MREMFSGSIKELSIAGAAVGVIFLSVVGTEAQGSAASGTAPAAAALKTPWGEPDLQGIWTDEFDTPLQRPAKYANQEFFTEAQRAELDKERATLIDRDKRGERGTEADVSQAYNFAVFLSTKHAGARTSLIVDPSNGRIPPLTPEAQKAAAADREFQLALLQATETCKTKAVECNGGIYDPMPSPRRAELPPRYNTATINRHDGPEDGTLANRCLTGGLPEFGTAFGGSFRRIVQTPGGISMFYDVGQGQGWQRNIVMDGSAISNTSPRSKIRRCGRGLGPSSKTSPNRAMRRTGFITSRAALKEIMPSPGGCAGGAWKSSPLRRDEVPIRQPGTA
jgi:hypothetical protein